MSTTPEEPVVPPEDSDGRTDSATDRCVESAATSQTDTSATGQVTGTTTDRVGSTTADRSPPPADSRSDSTVDPVVSRTDEEAPEQLELLDDEYAREILTVLSRGPRKGRELADTCGFSRSTVYRRLNRLEDAGLVATDLRIDPGGNHCKEFSLVRDSLRVEIGDGAIIVTARQSSGE